MGKPGNKKPNKKANKNNSVKINNKTLNKQNRSKHKNKSDQKKLSKNLKLSKKANRKLNGHHHDHDQTEDVQLFGTRPAGYDDFLDENEERQIIKRHKRKLTHEDDDQIEETYNVNASYIKQNTDWNRKKQLALPIKTKQGQLLKNVQENGRYADEKMNEELPESSKTDSNQVAETRTVEMVEEPKSVLDLMREKKESFDRNKQKIAHLSRLVIENPQEQTKKLRELRSMLTLPEIRQSLMLKKILIVSLCEVFKDICPSYKIRQWSDKENQQNVSKDVKELREFEETLLKQYKLYIDFLNESINSSNKFLLHNRAADVDQDSADKQKFESMRNYLLICVRCVCQAYEKLHYFNFSNDLLEIICQQLTSRIDLVSKLTNETIRSKLKADKSLHLSLEVVQKISKLLRQKSFGVRSQVLDVFLDLNLSEINVLDDKQKNKKMKHKDKMRRLSRTERKKLKEKEKLEEDLEEKQITDRLKEKSNLQARILEQLFTIYFKILKKNSNIKLIPSVLEGLSKFAHLINLDFFGDLLKLMHEMIESDNLIFRSKLHCIKTVFVVLSGQGEALTIDPVKFYTSLYNVILKLNASNGIEDVYLLVDCIEMMFFKRQKQIPTARLLSFIKRLSILTLQLDAAGAAVILHVLRRLILINKSSDLLFDNEYQDNGLYNAELTEPDYVNAQNSSLWELHLLDRHCNSSIADNASVFLKQGTNFNANDIRVNIKDIAAQIDKNLQEFYENPPSMKKNSNRHNNKNNNYKKKNPNNVQ